MSAGGANNSTIELVHGGYVHVKHSANEVAAKIEEARLASVVRHRVWHPDNTPSRGQYVEVPIAGPPPLIELERMEGTSARQARGFPTVHLNINHIVGVFPLTSQSEVVRSSAG